MRDWRVRKSLEFCANTDRFLKSSTSGWLTRVAASETAGGATFFPARFATCRGREPRTVSREPRAIPPETLESAESE